MADSEKQTFDFENPLLFYYSMLRRRWFIIVGFMTALAATVGVTSLTGTKYYGASSTVEISPYAPTVMRLDQVTDIVPTNLWGDEYIAYYQTQYQIIVGRKVLEDAVRSLQEAQGETAFDGMEHPEDALRGMTTVIPQTKTHLVKIRVEYTDPEKAALFANAIAQSYIRFNLARSKQQTENAMAFLTKQQEQYRQRRKGSEEKVQKYRSEHGLVGPESNNSTIEAELLGVRAKWTDVHARRQSAEATLAETEKQRKRSGGTTALAQQMSREQPGLATLLQQREDLKAEQAKLQTRYKGEYPELVRVNERLTAIDRHIDEYVDNSIAAKKTELALLVSEEDQLGANLRDAETEVTALAADKIALNLLEADAERDELFYKSLDQRMTEVGLAAAMESNNVRQTEDARAEPVPVRPKVMQNVLSALLMGAIGGAVLALVLEQLDATVKSKEDLELSSGVPFLGVVPVLAADQLKLLQSEVDRSVVAYALPQSNVAECMRLVRTNILFRANNIPLHTLLITSASPREGKSFMAANLASIIAMSGTRVLAIDGDMRRPTLHNRFQISNERGLAQVLAGDALAADVIVPSHVPGLHLMVAGPANENPSELLSLTRIKALLEAVDGYDLILIDSPPVNVVADPLVLASFADGVVFVVEASRTKRAMVRSCCEKLREVNPNLLGAVVNKLDVRTSGYEYNYYYDDYAYYSGDPNKPRKGLGRTRTQTAANDD
jgi:succinoglycan biosynthesis transport protein ExoP